MSDLDPADPRVKCCNCGFLAVRDAYSNQIHEATKVVRERGQQVNSSGSATVAQPLCYAAQRKFTTQEIGDQNLIVRTLDSPIQCKGFAQWREGITPKELAEMLLHQEIREDSKRQAVLDRQWRERMAEREEMWHEQNLRTIIEGTRATTKSTIVAALIGAAAALVVGVLVWYLTWITTRP